MTEPIRDPARLSTPADAPSPSTITDGRSDSKSDATLARVASPAGFEMLGELGRGGMGVVYRARDERLRRDIAVKFLHDRYTSSSPTARRFLDEAIITGGLQHPGIPPVHQVGEMPDGRPFLAMKLIQGRTLAEILAEGSAGRGTLVAVFEQVCHAVAYAHANGVIHRDLKPQNVMVGAFNEVQVMDWGLAKVRPAAAAAGESSREDAEGEEISAADRTVDHHPAEAAETRPGSVLGTPAFMAPEQARGEVQQVDTRSDVFGLGAILCMILTGRPPFESTGTRSSLQVAAAGRLDEAYARLEACGAEVELLAICKQCLSPARDDRPRDAGEVARSVAAFRAAVEERARQAELDRVRVEGERAKAEAETREQRKRRKVQLALLAALLLLVTGGGVFAWWQDRQAAERRMRNDRNAIRIEALLEQCESALLADSTARAETPLVEAEQRYAEGGAEEYADRLARCRADFDILHELDIINDSRWLVVAGRFPGSEAVASQWPEAFANFGIVPGATPVDDAVAGIRQSHVHERLLTALDLWLLESRSPDLLALLHAVDPDEYRDRVRAATATWSPDRLMELAMQEAAFQQPAHFAVVLGSNIAVPFARRVAILESVADRRPDDFEVLMSLANLHETATKLVEEHEKWLRAALAVRPDNPAALGDLGLVMFAKGRHVDAITAFREAILNEPKLAVHYDNLGLALLENKQIDEAIEAFQMGIEADPTDVQIRTNLANTLFARGDMDGAIATCRDALAFDPKNVTAHNIMGMALTNKGELDQAIATHKEAIKHDPKNASAYLHLGIAMKFKMDFEGAVAAWKQAAAHEPMSALPHTFLGEHFYRNGQYPDAVDSLSKAVEADPSYVNALVLLGVAHREMGNTHAARAAFTRAGMLDKSKQVLLWTVPVDVASPPRVVPKYIPPAI